MSEAAIRRYETGRREPERHLLRLLAELAPPELRGKTEDRPPGRLRGLISTKVGGRKYSEEAITAAHDALDLVFDNAPSEVITEVQALLEKHAAQWRRDS